MNIRLRNLTIFTTLAMVLAAVFGLAVPQTTHADVNNFTISDYKIEYDLSRGSDNRSVLKTTETITAKFPQSNQNHGIERYIPKNYDKHPTGLNITSVKSPSGASADHTEYSSGKYTVLRIGDKNKYVHGEQTYVIEYTQRDVTKYFADNQTDEFYWDANGTEWRVPINNLSVTLNVSDDLMSAHTGEAACYSGKYGSKDKCELAQSDGVFSTQKSNLTRGDNITLAVGFKQSTFAGYEEPLVAKILRWWILAQIVLAVAMVVMLVWLIVRFYRTSNRSSEVNPISPEYIPPANTSVQVSATLYAASMSELTAQLIDFAVRRYIQVVEVKRGSLFVPSQYSFEIIKSVDDLHSEEIEVIKDLFGSTSVGAKITTKQLRKDISLYQRLKDNPLKLKKLIRSNYGIRHRQPKQAAWFKKTGWIFTILAVVLLSPPMFVVAITSFIMGATLWVLTDKGLKLRRYLMGLKMYISVAEKDRLRMLQSPEGAEKTGLSNPDEGQIVRLYERLLPYAILFGYESQWNKQLGRLYESTDSSPAWYVGAQGAAFNAAVFSSAMTSLTSSISSSGASSSTSSGSSGGGFSGGGGGGGGGGGW